MIKKLHSKLSSFLRLRAIANLPLFSRYTMHWQGPISYINPDARPKHTASSWMPPRVLFW